MGYQVGSACYSTAKQAAQASASSQIGTLVNRGGVPNILDVLEVDESSITYLAHPLVGGPPLISKIPYNAQPCGLLQAEDGLTIGWMIAAAWIGAYALLFIARVLRGETGENYGNS